MIKKILWSLLFILAAAILQSTLLRYAAIFDAIPDFTLIILVFIAYGNGAMPGQVTGFLSGLMMDFLSSAPLGFNAFYRTLIGGLVGMMKGNFYLNNFLLPMTLCAGATLIKGASRLLLHLLLPRYVPAFDFTLPIFWVELGLNIILAPFIFSFLELFKSLLLGKGKKDVI